MRFNVSLWAFFNRNFWTSQLCLFFFFFFFLFSFESFPIAENFFCGLVLLPFYTICVCIYMYMVSKLEG